jgi:hypothetical protein
MEKDVYFALTSSFETSSSKTASNTNSCFSTYSVRSTYGMMWQTLTIEKNMQGSSYSQEH